MPSAVDSSSVIPLWFFSTKDALKPISSQEELWAARLSEQRQWVYRHSRGNLRFALSQLFNVEALDIPLIAKPGHPPHLKSGLGYVSLSHCRDALLIGWSKFPIGVDIERLDRPFLAKKISSRYFSSEENKQISNLPFCIQRLAVLEKWLIKESAIKWQQGSIAEDLINWHTKKDSSLIVNNKLSVSLNSLIVRHNEWSTAVVSSRGDLSRIVKLCVN